MSLSTDIYVTPSTSLVLIKSLSSVNNVYLADFNVPSFNVSIRDTTGLPSINTNPVNISTINSARFADGSCYYALNQPYGFVNLSLRTSNVWQINHTSGQDPSQSAANVINLYASTTYLSLLSTAQKRVSSYVVENFFSPNPLTVTGSFVANNFSTPGFVLFEQNLNLYDDLNIQKSLFVSSYTTISGSFYSKGIEPLSSVVHIYSSVGVGGDVYVRDYIDAKNTVSLQSSIQVTTLQVTQSSVQDTVQLQGNLRMNQSFSTLGNVAVAQQTLVDSNMVVSKQVSSLGRWSTNDLVVRGNTELKGLTSIAQANFLSSFFGMSTANIQGNIQLGSTMGIVGSLYTAAFSTLGFSTLGSLSTVLIDLTSTVSVTGNMSSVYFSSFQYFSIGGQLVSQSTISSLSNTRIQGEVQILGNALFNTLHTSSSVGVTDLTSVFGSTLATNVTIRQTVSTSKNLQTLGYTDITGSVAVGTGAYFDSNLTVYGISEISSFLVESFLLSNLQIRTSSPFVSFQASSLHASSFQTEATLISTPPPDIWRVSSTYASTTQVPYAIAENSRFEHVFTDTFYVSSPTSLSEDSKPRFVLGVDSYFAKGISTVTVLSDRVEAQTIEGSLVGNVKFLSNIQVPFVYMSAQKLVVSTLNQSTLLASTFTASTFINHQLTNVVSTVIAPYLVFESQGFKPRYDVNQFLTINPSLMAVNRNLYFDRLNNRVGLFISSPTCDFDVSGFVYAENVFYSSLNKLNLSSVGTVFFSTIYVSSSYVRDSLQFGTQGLELYAGVSNFNINTTGQPSLDMYGIYDCVSQSSILLNGAVQIYRNQKVTINGVQQTGDVYPPTHALDVFTTLATQQARISTANLFECLQSKTLMSPYLVINCNTSNTVNKISACIGKIAINEFMTIQDDLYSSNRLVGIHTLYPNASLDVRGNAYFSSVSVFENMKTNYLGMGINEI